MDGELESRTLLEVDSCILCHVSFDSVRLEEAYVYLFHAKLNR